MCPIFESSLSKPYPIGWHIPLLIFQVEPYRIGHNPSPNTRTHPSGIWLSLSLAKESTQWGSCAEQEPMWAPGWNIKASSFSFLLSYKRKEPKRILPRKCTLLPHRQLTRTGHSVLGIPIPKSLAQNARDLGMGNTMNATPQNAVLFMFVFWLLCLVFLVLAVWNLPC